MTWGAKNYPGKAVRCDWHTVTASFNCTSNNCKVGSNIGKSTFVVSNPTIQSILDRSRTYEIFSNVRINKNDKRWRNIYRYGNSNNERAPALWIFPNNPWRFHFRVGTNRNWNDGQDFNIPGNMRRYNYNLD